MKDPVRLHEKSLDDAHSLRFDDDELSGGVHPRRVARAARCARARRSRT